jgi:putative hydrolase of the HAD superfamily
VTVAIKALTLDFRNTMVIARSNGRARWDRRLGHVLGLAQRYDHTIDQSAVADGVRAAAAEFDRLWRKESRTLATADMVSHLWSHLGLSVSDEEHAHTVEVFEESLLAGPPDFTDGLVSFLREASRRYKLAIISDTMFSPGRVLRIYLDRAGIRDYFQAFVFSDETGFSKPDPRSFRHALDELRVDPREAVHIGDLLRTDVIGAQRVHMGAVLYAGVEQDVDGDARPDSVAYHWTEVSDYLNEITESR